MLIKKIVGERPITESAWKNNRALLFEALKIRRLTKRKWLKFNDEKKPWLKKLLIRSSPIVMQTKLGISGPQRRETRETVESIRKIMPIAKKIVLEHLLESGKIDKEKFQSIKKFFDSDFDRNLATKDIRGFLEYLRDFLYSESGEINDMHPSNPNSDFAEWVEFRTRHDVKATLLELSMMIHRALSK